MNPFLPATGILALAIACGIIVAAAALAVVERRARHAGRVLADGYSRLSDSGRDHEGFK